MLTRKQITELVRLCAALPNDATARKVHISIACWIEMQNPRFDRVRLYERIDCARRGAP